MGQSELNPFGLSEDLRNYFYNKVVLSWEMGVSNIRSDRYNKRNLSADVGFRVENFKKISDLERRVSCLNDSSEFLIFHIEGKGYECLFKRLRDAFAHGHYGCGKSDWVTIFHRYKSRGQKVEQIRLLAKLHQSSIKKLIDLLSV